MLLQSAPQVEDVAGGEVQALGAGGRHDVGRVAGQEQPAMPHGLGHEAAQGRDALLDGRAGGQAGGGLGIQPEGQFGVEAVVGPVLDRVVQPALDVEPAAGRRAHRTEGEAALGGGIDQLFRHRRPVDHHPQPAERIDPLIGAQYLGWNGLAAGSVEAVAAGDEVALQLVAFAVLYPGQAWAGTGDVQRRHLLGLVDGLEPRGRAGLHQVAGDLGLAIDGDRLAGQGGEIDAVARAAEAEFDALMDQAFRMQALGDARLFQQSYRAVFDQSGADAAQHMVAAAPLENDIVDARGMQQLAQ